MLDRLDVGLNQLEALPSALGHCVALRKLIVSGNWLTQLDESILRLPVLDELWASDNRLATIPTSEAWGAICKASSMALRLHSEKSTGTRIRL